MRLRKDLHRSLLLLLKPNFTGDEQPPVEEPAPLPPSGASKLTRPPQRHSYVAGRARLYLRALQPRLTKHETAVESTTARSPDLILDDEFHELVETVFLLTR